MSAVLSTGQQGQTQSEPLDGEARLNAEAKLNTEVKTKAGKESSQDALKQAQRPATGPGGSLDE
jgi:hypothetical protein